MITKIENATQQTKQNATGGPAIKAPIICRKTDSLTVAILIILQNEASTASCCSQRARCWDQSIE